MQLYGIVGAGGFGREVMPSYWKCITQVQHASDFELVFIEDHGIPCRLNGHRVLRTEEFLALRQEKYFNIAVADYKTREKSPGISSPVARRRSRSALE